MNASLCDHGRRGPAVQLVTADRVILDALADGPLSTREISVAIMRRARDEWAERENYVIEWETDAEPLGARILAHGEAREQGWKLSTWEILPRCYRLEKRGAVGRIQIAGHRPMLWERRV